MRTGRGLCFLVAVALLTAAIPPRPGTAQPAGPAPVQLPEIGDEDVPRRAPLPPPVPRDTEADQPDPRAQFGEVIDVVNTTFAVRVLGDDGAPVTGLGPDDFLAVSEDGRRLPVVSVEWVPWGERVERWEAQPRSGEAAPPDAGDTAPGPEPRRLSELPGKLVVVFVQADFNAERIYGHLKMLPNVRRLLHTLAPRDRVAVVSFDTHMELWQDFTTDREAAGEAIWRAVHFGADPPSGQRRERGGGPSLAALLDPREMADAAYAENALELLGLALGELPGDKLVLFVGWGLGRYGFGGFRMRPNDYPQAREALQHSNASVFVLDVMDARSHTLELGLQQVAAETGGVYVRTAVNPMQAFRRMAQALSGYYRVTLNPGGARAGEVSLSLLGAEPGVRVRVQPLSAGG